MSRGARGDDVGGRLALATRDTIFLKFVSKARADWRASTCAALIGAGMGLTLGAAYMAGGMARTAADYARASRIAEAAAGGFSEAVLQEQAASMDAGALRIASRHDPFADVGAAQRDRQNSIVAAYLERPPQAPSRLIRLRGVVDPASAGAGGRLGNALDGSRELECLTQAVYYEARGETPAGQAAVAQVVLNRVRHPAFPKSVCGVVFQGAGKRVGCQFSFACDGSMRRGRETAAWRRAERVASRALAGKVVASVGNATHFHTVNVAPAWGPRLIRTAEVGMHIFYRLGKPLPRAVPKPEERVLYASLTASPPPQELKVAGTMRAAVLKTEGEESLAKTDKKDAATAKPALSLQDPVKPTVPVALKTIPSDLQVSSD